MLSKALLLQQIYHGSEYAEALAMTYPRHLLYCHKFGIDYHTYYSNVIEKWDMRLGGWAKLPLILGALSNGYEHVIWLDADALIADLNTDIRVGCPEFGIGMVQHKLTDGLVHNVGVMYVTNSERVRAFIRDWITWFPGPIDGWHEQAMLNLLAVATPYLGIVVPIADKWNSCRQGNTHVDDAVVEGFHGEGVVSRRNQLMKEWLERNIK